MSEPYRVRTWEKDPSPHAVRRIEGPVYPQYRQLTPALEYIKWQVEKETYLMRLMRAALYGLPDDCKEVKKDDLIEEFNSQVEGMDKDCKFMEDLHYHLQQLEHYVKASLRLKDDENGNLICLEDEEEEQNVEDSSDDNLLPGGDESK